MGLLVLSLNYVDVAYYWRYLLFGWLVSRSELALLEGMHGLASAQRGILFNALRRQGWQKWRTASVEGGADEPRGIQ